MFQYDLSLKEGVGEAHAEMLRGLLYEQLTDLADRILEGFTVQLQSIQQATTRHKEMLQQYEQTRTALIMPLGQSLL